MAVVAPEGYSIEWQVQCLRKDDERKDVWVRFGTYRFYENAKKESVSAARAGNKVRIAHRFVSEWMEEQ